jgi:hypothetical protein
MLEGKEIKLNSSSQTQTRQNDLENSNKQQLSKFVKKSNDIVNCIEILIF